MSDKIEIYECQRCNRDVTLIKPNAPVEKMEAFLNDVCLECFMKEHSGWIKIDPKKWG